MRAGSSIGSAFIKCTDYISKNQISKPVAFCMYCKLRFLTIEAIFQVLLLYIFYESNGLSLNIRK